MKLEDIKFIPIFVRYILPLFEMSSFVLVHEKLMFMAQNNQINPNEAMHYNKYIMCTIFIGGFLLVLKYRSKLAIFLQLIVLFFLLFCVGMDQSMNYRIAH